MQEFQDRPHDQVATPRHEIQSFSPAVETLSKELIGQIADKWSMIVLEELVSHGTLRFSELRRLIPEVSQKMLTQTLRRMERIGLVSRTVYPVIPPNVEYQHTALGHSLGQAVCGLWTWVERHAADLEQAQQRFDEKVEPLSPVRR